MKNYNLLITNGDLGNVKDHAKYNAELWVHNGLVVKNHVSESDMIALKNSFNQTDKQTFETVFNEIVEINKIDPADHSKRLSKLFEESGELAKEINKVTGRKVLSVEDTEEAIKQNICDEAADTIQNVISLVETFGISAQDIINSIARGNVKWVKNVSKRKGSKCLE